MRTIHFKKQMLGKWRRNDGESSVHVTEETMHREIAKLLNDGWRLTTDGVTMVRGYTLTRGDKP